VRDNRRDQPYEAEDKDKLRHSLIPFISLPASGMVHLRLNAREANPNPHINWINALPQSQPSQDATNAAQELLRALAAQVRPVMKKHG
jgi:hypothetical protein